MNPQTYPISLNNNKLAKQEGDEKCQKKMPIP
jgi:hypothetical protein